VKAYLGPRFALFPVVYFLSMVIMHGHAPNLPKEPGSTSAWEAVSNGTRRQLAPGQTIKLAPGAKIDFGSTDGEVG
jgi:hypothetical protein